MAFGIVVLLGAGLWLFNRDAREDLTLADVTASSRESGYASEALGGLRDRTGTLCEGVEGCAEVYASSEVELFRFETKDAARDFASSAGDAFIDVGYVTHANGKSGLVSSLYWHGAFELVERGGEVPLDTILTTPLTSIDDTILQRLADAVNEELLRRAAQSVAAERDTTEAVVRAAVAAVPGAVFGYQDTYDEALRHATWVTIDRLALAVVDGPNGAREVHFTSLTGHVYAENQFDHLSDDELFDLVTGWVATIPSAPF